MDNTQSKQFPKELDELKDALAKGNIPDPAAKIKEELDLLERTTLNIAITGFSGAGKSSLVNALRGMTDYEKGSAKTGVTETTKRPVGYPHPVFPNVTIWDLPGIETTLFKAENYLKLVGFDNYDFFIIVAGDRFTVHDSNLAHEIKKLNKKFYYVRTKLDVSLSSEARKPNFNEMQSLKRIREYCYENLKEAGESSPRVFLISSWDLSKYDFPLLLQTLESELGGIKKEVLIMAMPTFSKESLRKKQQTMESLIWKVSLLSCAVGLTPVPGLSLACDIAILVKTMKDMYKAFGLDDDSLRILAHRVGKPFDELHSAIKNIPSGGEITIQFVRDSLKKSLLWGTLTVVELALDFVPIVGSVFGGASSLASTYCILKSFLRDVVKDAENVRAKAFER
ncbi:interferon-inducible GTPase 5-like [Elgaria multicarinata webbii]|uniref:interferon-inducible GTPase 5-like n=1 Tax=Elgaria multicarinata webbii TaxID=159646 RepID=UPI002FCD3042